VHNASLTAKIDGTMPNLTEPKHALTLYFAVAKESDFIIRKGVELGIKRFVPFMSKRVNADFNRNRCEKIVREAVKQCERAVVPEIDGIIAFEELICRISNAPNTFFCYENHKGDSLLAALSRHIAARNAPADTVNLIVGCEGGFEDNEAAQIIAANATPVSLGARILKVETAVIAAVAIVNAVNEGCCSFVSGQL
jgi:16S rRNA (uracil1498-N3)-methyltransferase